MNNALDSLERAVESSQRPPLWFVLTMAALLVWSAWAFFRVRTGLQEAKRQAAENFILTGKA